MDLPASLSLSKEGEAWLRVLNSECLEGLCAVHRRLEPYWLASQCVPPLATVLRPFRCIDPGHVKAVLICKEPYAKKDYTGQSMATGIPVETSSGFETPSAKAFKRLATRLWGSEANNGDFMQCFYRHGILVINASFTAEAVQDKRYALAASHHPLWCKFTYPLMRLLRDMKVVILAVGIEARHTVRCIDRYTALTCVPFPQDKKSCDDFVRDGYSVLCDCA